MPRPHRIHFGPFALDPLNACLWEGTQALTLWPKDFAVLHYLVTYAGRLVTKDELLAAVWPETFVSDGVLKGCIRRIRRVLGENPRTPRFIQTVHRRGYRWIALLTEANTPETALAAPERSEGSAMPFVGLPFLPPSLVVGRETELAHLHACLAQACGGTRQMVCLTGEAGIGKTTLVDAFIADIATSEHIGIAYGQCVEHYGSGEPYQPVLEALGRWYRNPGGEPLRALLRQHAPTWLAQMPGLLSPSDDEALQRLLTGTTQQRMLRELAEALEIITVDTPLVLVLEDLHWSDYATLDLLAVLARRREAARLLILGTYRPTDVLVQEHPLSSVVHELCLHGQCTEWPLGLLSNAAIAAYLASRFPDQNLPTGLVSWLYQRTEGNPLFLVNMVEHAMHQGWMQTGAAVWDGPTSAADGDIPETLRQLIERQLAHQGEEAQQLLAAGSVAGLEFTATAVAAALAVDVTQVEAGCEVIIRRGHFLRRQGDDVWPDGTVTAQYGFAHTLYREVLYNRLPPVQRQRLHQRIATRLEAGYGGRAHDIAAELAIHWERGHGNTRAVRYRRQAADNALRRHAHREAISHLTAGLQLLQGQPDTPERAQQELALQDALGLTLMVTEGYAALEVGNTYARAHVLCQRMADAPQRASVLHGLWAFHLNRAEYHTAHDLGQQLLTLGQHGGDPAPDVGGHQALGTTLFFLGEFGRCVAHCEQTLALYDRQQTQTHPIPLFFWQDPAVICLSFAAWALGLLGFPDQALQRSKAALVLAQEHAQPFGMAWALTRAMAIRQMRREKTTTQRQAEAAMTLSTEYGFQQLLAQAMILWGWAVAEQGQVQKGTEQIGKGLAIHQATGALLGRSYWLYLLAETYSRAGQTAIGLQTLEEAFTVVRKTQEHVYLAELYRLQGELLLRQDIPDEHEAELSLQQALATARQQGARWLELRAASSLSRLWLHQGKRQEARALLTPIYGWFTEGFETVDLQAAKDLLDELR